MSPLRGELDVIRLLRMTQNNAVKAVVIFKLGEHVQAEALHVHPGDRGQVISRPDYPHRRTRLHSHQRLTSKNSVRKPGTIFSQSENMGSSVDWKKRFESGRLGAWEINVTGKSGVIVGVRLPAVGGIIFLAIERETAKHGAMPIANTLEALSKQAGEPRPRRIRTSVQPKKYHRH